MTGSITFNSGRVSFVPATIVSGVATFPTTVLLTGTDLFTASYGGELFGSFYHDRAGNLDACCRDRVA